MKLQTAQPNILNVANNDIALFQKVEIINKFQVYNCDEDHLVSKLELLLNKFDEIFRA